MTYRVCQKEVFCTMTIVESRKALFEKYLSDIILKSIYKTIKSNSNVNILYFLKLWKQLIHPIKLNLLGGITNNLNLGSKKFCDFTFWLFYNLWLLNEFKTPCSTINFTKIYLLAMKLNFKLYNYLIWDILHFILLVYK